MILSPQPGSTSFIRLTVALLNLRVRVSSSVIDRAGFTAREMYSRCRNALAPRWRTFKRTTLPYPGVFTLAQHRPDLR